VLARTAILSVTAGALAIAGCASLLGDFSSGATGDAGPIVLTGDAGTAEAGFAFDGQAPADAQVGPIDAATPLSCTTWRYAGPRLLDTLAAGDRRVRGALSVVSGPGPQARVIVGKAKSGVAFSSYTIDTADAGATAPTFTQLDAPIVAGSEYAGWARGGAGVEPATTVLAYAPAGDSGSTLGAFSAYVLPDSLAAAGPVPPPYAVFAESAQVPEVDAIRVLPLDSPNADAGSPPSLFVAVTYPASTPADANASQYVLGVGVATGGPSASPATLETLATSPNVDALNDPRLFQANGRVYVFDTDDPSSPGLSEWSVADDASVPSRPLPRAVLSGTSGTVESIAPNTSTAAADIALEQQVSVGGYVTAIQYFAGAVPYGGLATWTPSPQASPDGATAPSLNAVESFTNVFTAPDGIPCGSVWSGDNIMLLGPGLAPADDGGTLTPGLNMLWFDATGAIHGSQSGTGALLSQRQGFTNAAASPSYIGASSARWDVAWVETRTDDAGAYDVIYYDELDCE